MSLYVPKSWKDCKTLCQVFTPNSASFFAILKAHLEGSNREDDKSF